MMTFEEAVKKSLQNRRPDLYRFLLKIGAKRAGFKKLKLNDIKIDQGIYPREGTDWDRVEIYAEAMKNGDQFPPLITAKDPKNLLVDGNHRYYGLQKTGFTEYWIEEWDIPKNKIKLAAQALNSEPGNIEMPLTGKEKKRAIIQDWEDGIRDVNLIAEALKTTPSYVRKVLSQAGLIRDIKEEMKKRAKELKEQGLNSRQIAQKLSEEFGERVPDATVRTWLLKNYPGKNSTPPDTPTVRSVLDDPEKLVEQEEKELSEAEKEETLQYARYKDTDIPLSTIEYWVGECRSYVESGSSPEEAVELAGVHPNVKKYVIEELKERFYKDKEREEEIQKWVDLCKPYVQMGFTPKQAVENAKVPEELRVPVVKKLVGFSNHLWQEEEREFKAKLGPVDSRRRDIIIKAHRLVSLIQEIEHDLKQLDQILLRNPEGDEDLEHHANYYGRDQYIRDRLTFILVRGGWEKAEWFREITLRYVRYTLHPEHAKEFLPDIKEQAKLTPEEWEKASQKFWEENLASEAELEWKKFCEALGLPIPKEMGGTE